MTKFEENEIKQIIKFSKCNTFCELPFINKKWKGIVPNTKELPSPIHKNEFANIDILQMFKRLDSTDNLSIQVDDEVLAILNTNIANQFSNIRVLYEGVIWSTIMKKYSPKLENILFCGKIDYSHVKQMAIKIVDLIKNIELIKS